MAKAELLDMLAFTRTRTLGMLDQIAKMPNAQAALGYRPGPGRAHTAWQLMHIAATDDRHVNARMSKTPSDPKDPELVRRFAGGSTPDDTIPSVEEIRQALTARRDVILKYLESIPDSALDTKPNDASPWTFREWIKVVNWHEAHHQGQAHLTLNMFKSQSEAK